MVFSDVESGPPNETKGHGTGNVKSGRSQDCAVDGNARAGGRIQPSTSVLITGIGCVGKSNLRRRIADALGPKVVCMDCDDGTPEPTVAPDQILVVESVHGLDEPPERWGLIVYLLPPRRHSLRWLRRAFAWFRTGRVDRPPRALRRRWSPLNIPLIVRLVCRNIRYANRWVREDLRRVDVAFRGHVVVTSDEDEAFREVVNFMECAREGRKNDVE